MVPNTQNRPATPNSETNVVRHSGHAFCPVCEKPVDLLSFSAAARLFKTDRQDITFLAESCRLHRVHNKRGQVIICALSLFDFFERGRQNRSTPIFPNRKAYKAAS